MPGCYVSAQLTSFCGPDTGTPCINDITSLFSSIESLIWIVFGAVALVCFVIAGILFLTAQGAPEKLKTARSAFIWGIAGVVVGILAYSIISIVGSFMTGSL